jgi:hypothetical protein
VQLRPIKKKAAPMTLVTDDSVGAVHLAVITRHLETSAPIDHQTSDKQ